MDPHLQGEQVSKVIISTLKQRYMGLPFDCYEFKFLRFFHYPDNCCRFAPDPGDRSDFYCSFRLDHPSGAGSKSIDCRPFWCSCRGISIIIIPSLEQGGFSGNLFGIGKALAFAAGTIAIRRRRSVNLLPSLALAAVITAAGSALFVENYALSLRSLFILMYLGIIQLGAGFILFVSWSGKLPTSQTGLIVILEAFLGPLWVWFFLGEVPHIFTFLGGAVIIGTLIAHTLIFYRKPREDASI